MSRIITLTTDFGQADEYAGVMKGVILSRAPQATIVDLSHLVGKQNIRQAALVIKSAYKFFPDRTIHLVVVDPGVGSSRKLILLQADKHLFLAPDNGVLGLLLEPETFEAAYEVQCQQYYLTPVSSTFHGRDILAPLAAQLAIGLEPVNVGSSVARHELLKLELAEAKIDVTQGIITGEIIGLDHFGNLQTNIDLNSLQGLYGENKANVIISVRDKTIAGIQGAYSFSGNGKILAIIDSRNFLEIAVYQGSAVKLLEAGIGDEVRVEMAKA